MANKLMVVVKTYDLVSGKQEDERVVDMNSPGTLGWYRQHSLWAWVHHKGVQSYNQKDDET